MGLLCRRGENAKGKESEGEREIGPFDFKNSSICFSGE